MRFLHKGSGRTHQIISLIKLKFYSPQSSLALFYGDLRKQNRVQLQGYSPVASLLLVFDPSPSNFDLISRIKSWKSCSYDSNIDKGDSGARLWWLGGGCVRHLPQSMFLDRGVLD